MLKLVKQLFNQLQDVNINYCLFKEFDLSKDMFDGEEDDIDILVSKLDFNKFDKLVKSNGFFRANKKIIDDGIFYYIGFDIEEMKYIILHVHTKIRIGNKINKEYHYKFESLILSRKKYNKKFNFYYIDECDEILLLSSRLCMKKKRKNEDIDRLKYLLTTVKDIPKNYDEISMYLYNMDFNSMISILSQKDILKALKKLNSNLKKSRKRQYIGILFRTVLGKVFIISSSIKRKLNIPRYRIHFMGNLYALQGIDGAGKSTQLEIIKKNEFLKLTGIKTIYGGNNQYWWPFLYKRLKFFANKKDIFSKFYRKWLSILVIFDRRLRLVKAYAYMLRGYNVVFDRYFYDDLAATMRLKLENKKSGIASRLFQTNIGKTPKRTFFLSLTAEEAYRRKQDYPFDVVQIMIKSYNNVFKNRNEVIKIDATQSIESISKIIAENIIYADRRCDDGNRKK